MLKSLHSHHAARVERRTVHYALALLVGSGIPLLVSAADATPSDDVREVVVSARRQSESAMKVPESITAFDSAALENLGVEKFGDYASKVANLSFQYGGSGGSAAALGFGGSRAIAIRGVAGTDTTGMYIDDTPIPPTIDPQVVDLARIEVLKGPQGSLYGAGSMGGNIRMISNAPRFERELKYTIDAGYTDHAGSPDGRLVVIGNTPLSDSLALRVVGFLNHDGGFIARTYPVGSGGELGNSDNQGAVTSYGASATALLKFNDALKITPRIIWQQANASGWPVAFAPLPAFAVTSLTQVRAANVPESYNDKWYLPSLQVEYGTDAVDLSFSSSYFYRRLHNLEDGTEGTSTVLSGPPYNAAPGIFAAGVPWPQLQINSNVYHELRAAWKGTEHVRAIAGAYYSNQVTKWENGSLSFTFPQLVSTGTWDTPVLWDQHENIKTLERALYGEMYLTGGGFELTLGGRKFWLEESFSNSNFGFVNYGPYTAIAPEETSETGFSPKASLSYSATDTTMVYATASKGYRPGGPNNPITAACDLTSLGLTADQLKSYHSDSLWNYEVGAKSRLGDFNVTAAAFQMNWSQVQQNTTLPVCFLPATGNAGAARIRGGELEVSGRIAHDFDARVSLGYQDPRITSGGLTGQAVGSRLYQVPFFTGSAVLGYTHPLYDQHDGFVTLDYSYTGNSVSDTTASLFGIPPAVRAGYGVLNGRLGVRWGQRELALFAKNITNRAANLGDINPIAYEKIDANATPVPRVAILRPFQVGVEFRIGM